jgi:hypothetical protein
LKKIRPRKAVSAVPLAADVFRTLHRPFGNGLPFSLTRLEVAALDLL